MTTPSDRRKFLGRAAALGAGLGAAAISSGVAAESGASQGGRGEKGRHRAHSFVVPAETTGRCATCAFWGGQRHVNRAKTEVHATSLGMCNNPASPRYHTTTSPESGPMAVWARWPALDA
ncbi:MAG: twin-arginine translocation signal domain-containing protein [Gammaproteobacteria bacterium]